ncbi:GIY-YIG nuclease family protein [Phenylobacterium sp. 20VBR1]|uniref:GIY-YIG nuclease family protein n=1 Tax=Phenylobacterium glaciei TaxID=2803784 RepID=A0A941HW19_9CAUL|nr:GIY-YIG nuclease family protein [Phenylobacterium glaciei]MBR7618782.1 GIY-YIG nuclease family protein [Phenylobacterium glaciei]
MPSLISERPDLFHLYQSLQDGMAVRAISRARHVAAFAGLEAGSAVFAGLFAVNGTSLIPGPEFWARPDLQELATMGVKGLEAGTDLVAMDLEPLDTWRAWGGKLTIDWPAPERSWFRRAERNRLPVSAITLESQFVTSMPPADELVLTWDQLRVIPASWRAKLAEWRGVYYVFDVRRRSGYVGSAAGHENLLGRWMSYSDSGHGGNAGLKASQPSDLRFSILQRTSPDLLRPEVEHIEALWKRRLHTRDFGLNEN